MPWGNNQRPRTMEGSYRDQWLETAKEYNLIRYFMFSMVRMITVRHKLQDTTRKIPSWFWHFLSYVYFTMLQQRQHRLSRLSVISIAWWSMKTVYYQHHHQIGHNLASTNENSKNTKIKEKTTKIQIKKITKRKTTNHKHKLKPIQRSGARSWDSSSNSSSRKMSPPSSRFKLCLC